MCVLISFFFSFRLSNLSVCVRERCMRHTEVNFKVYLVGNLVVIFRCGLPFKIFRYLLTDFWFVDNRRPVSNANLMRFSKTINGICMKRAYTFPLF